MAEASCISSESTTCLSRGQNIGVALNAESGIISITSVLILLVLIIRNVYRNLNRPPDERRSLVQGPADVLMLSLFAGDLIQGVGAAMNIRWANFGYVETGRFCTAQGAIQQLGETTVAMTTLAIAVQTFIAVCFRKFVHSRKPALIVIALIWLYVILFVALGSGLNGGTRYYEPTPYWCWIDAHYSTERIFGEYLWLWLTLFVSILVYIPLFLWGNGYMSVNKTQWWKVSFHLKPPALSEDANARDRPPSLSLTILGYPVLYSIIILPLTVCRWIQFSDPHAIPSAATFASIFLFGLSGTFNVLLLLTTRPNLLLFDSEPELTAARGAQVDIELATTAPSTDGTHGRGRTRRHRLHEKGRMATPSRSSSRGSHPWATSQEYDDDFELGVGPFSPCSTKSQPNFEIEHARDGENASQPSTTQF